MNDYSSQSSEDTEAKQSTSNAGVGECPLSHPFAFWHGGQYCCTTNFDHRGNIITLESKSCANQAKVKCPHGKCNDYQGLCLNFHTYLFT